jgi:hypothetical protein
MSRQLEVSEGRVFGVGTYLCQQGMEAVGPPTCGGLLPPHRMRRHRRESGLLGPDLLKWQLILQRRRPLRRRWWSLRRRRPPVRTQFRRRHPRKEGTAVPVA